MCNHTALFYWWDCSGETVPGNSCAAEFTHPFSSSVWWKEHHALYLSTKSGWRLRSCHIIACGEQVTAADPLWSLLLWSEFTLAAWAQQTHVPLLAICSDRASLTLVFIFKCSLWNLLCFSDEHHKRLMPICRRFSSSNLSPWQSLQAVFWQHQIYFCVCHLINCWWTIWAAYSLCM